MMAPNAQQPVTVIQATRGWQLLNLNEVWEYRELLLFLAWRDIKVRYKQTAVGVLWVVLQPLLMMIVFSVFFGQLARVPSDGLPYPLFALAGLTAWNLFARILSASSDSLVRDQRLISKVYFPRLLVPLSSCLAALLDFVIAFALLLVLMPFYGVAPSLRVLAIPLLVIILLVTSLGIGFWFSALNVEYRDVAYVVPFLTQLWFFMTPVVYPSSLVPEGFQLLYGLNPMVGVVEGFRWALLGTNPPSSLIFISAFVSVALFVAGLYWFKSRERVFADNLGS